MTELELIRKWGIPPFWIAGKIGLSKQNFNNKFHDNGANNKFSKGQLDQIKKVFKELERDLAKVNSLK